MPNPVDNQLCYISDLAQDVLSLMKRVTLLESMIHQVQGSNVTAVYVSDISQDLGVMVSGILTPAVIIHTSGNYAQYIYSSQFVPDAPIEVQGDIIIETPVNSTPYASPIQYFVRTQKVGFQVSTDGLYSFTANVSTNHLVNPFSTSSHAYGTAGWNLIVAAGVDPVADVSGNGEKGIFVERRVVF
jgi:hypothetical protein